MIERLQIEIRETAEEVLAVQIPAYRVEADLIGFSGIPPLHDTVETLVTCRESFYGYRTEEGKLAGAISYKRIGDLLDIHRMMVHPDYFRRGIAGSLLRFVECNEPGIRTIKVATGTGNESAKLLYQRNGFQEIGQQEVAPGITVTLFEKHLA
ncbi:GNAT family N-acetyltransferase [Brevibacillus humidisoli]|uniref:GNAT family N-acetyltransferase n=1 Tax=Brevibacillus humidisoli TaxID=2895522 RepID=UPI001E3B472C|nr:GNAT family N-acetyltransferase [Brevibacillus humidisoli]UFJ41548.1 GNAT family N-acetyltransferase [Brevibacillus humidisoli]